MAPAPVTEDFYMVLEIDQTATAELVTRSYRRLALKHHPDRNTERDSTAAFQLLGQAYETLKDESKRRAYDLIYPSIKRGRPHPQTAQSNRPPPASNPQSRVHSEAAQINALQKSRQDRQALWRTKKNAFGSSIFELRRDIQRLEKEIQNLDGIVAAEAAEEARKNSWGAWLLSPIYKRAEVSEEKEQKERLRQERRITKDMKERRLDWKKADLEKQESLLNKGQEEVDAADLVDDRKIRALQNIISAREARERQERERAQREQQAKIWKQQQEQREKQEREAAEALRKRQAEERAAAQKQQEEQAKIWKQQQEQREKREREAAEALRKRRAEERAAAQKQQEEQAGKRQRRVDDEQYPFTFQGSCGHYGWWPKVQGRTACPECHDIWTYLLKCPGCKMKACPKCQHAIRQRRNPRRP